MHHAEGEFCANDGIRRWPGNDPSGREMGGNKGKDFQRDAVYMDEGVLPLADSRQRGRCIPVELRNLIESEATK